MKKKSFGRGVMKSSGKISVVASIIVLVAFVAGLLVGSLVVVKSSAGKITLANPMTGAFADGWNAAKKKLAEFNPMMNNVSSLSGQVQSVNGKEVSFSTSLINPLDDESLKTRIAVINDDTKISVWKMKSAEQMAADQKDGQEEMAELQEESMELNKEMSSCMEKRMANPESGAGDACQAVNEKSNKMNQAMMAAQQKMDMYQKIENAGPGDIKAGWNISVTAAPAEKSADVESPMGMFSQYENIASSNKFIVSAIDVREVPSAPGMNPSSVQ
jgi:hypothetical protein